MLQGGDNDYRHGNIEDHQRHNQHRGSRKGGKFQGRVSFKPLGITQRSVGLFETPEAAGLAVLLDLRFEALDLAAAVAVGGAAAPAEE